MSLIKDITKRIKDNWVKKVITNYQINTNKPEDLYNNNHIAYTHSEKKSSENNQQFTYSQYRPRQGLKQKPKVKIKAKTVSFNNRYK